MLYSMRHPGIDKLVAVLGYPQAWRGRTVTPGSSSGNDRLPRAFPHSPCQEIMALAQVQGLEVLNFTLLARLGTSVAFAQFKRSGILELSEVVS